MMIRKLQLRQELNNIRQRNMSVADYTSKIKETCVALGSINMWVDEDKRYRSASEVWHKGSDHFERDSVAFIF